MTENLDELFGEGEGTPKPRARLVWGLLTGGLALAVLGLACSAAPGGLLVLLAWMVVEKELDRVDSGFLAEDERPSVLSMRRMTLAALFVVIVLFVVQGLLMCTTDMYEQLLDSMLGLLLAAE